MKIINNELLVGAAEVDRAKNNTFWLHSEQIIFGVELTREKKRIEQTKESLSCESRLIKWSGYFLHGK